MRVVMASAEAAPLAKTGGLADVVGALPAALRRLGADVSIVLPAFRGTIERAAAISTGRTVGAPISDRWVEAEIYEGKLPDGTVVNLVRHDAYFDRDALYGTAAGDYADNAERFAFFSRAVLALLQQVGAPDVLHCHDWQSALAAALLRADAGRYADLARTRSVLTIHNLGYQGFFWALDWHLLNIEFAYFNARQFESWGHINYLKAGIALADAITTVSRTYAEEICTPELGHGLDDLLRSRRASLHGILNGVDYSEWSPDTDRHIAPHFSRDDVRGKAACKAALQAELGLAAEPRMPLLVVISRFAGQKGIDLLVELGPALLERPIQVACLGTGDAWLQDALADLAGRGPGRIAVRFAFDEGLAHRMQAGADMLLMPSRYEPCGLNQIYALRYGNVPIVRATGGLVDTVADYDSATGAGTGFRFGPPSAAALLGAIDRARGWYSRPEAWARLMQNGMSADFSWDRSAEEYLDLYRQIAGA